MPCKTRGYKNGYQGNRMQSGRDEDRKSGCHEGRTGDSEKGLGRGDAKKPVFRQQKLYQRSGGNCRAGRAAWPGGKALRCVPGGSP